MALRIKFNKDTDIIERIGSLIQDNPYSAWIIDADRDISLADPMWKYHAWFRFKAEENQGGVFGIIGSKKYHMTKTLYAIYHSRLADLLLANFDTDIERLEITPLLIPNVDIVGDGINTVP